MEVTQHDKGETYTVTTTEQLHRLIYDPLIRFVSIAVAADFLGIAKSTAYDAAHTGELCQGVPVVRIGRRYLVATSHLRALAGTGDSTDD
jgi:hypothetical protein